MFGTVPWFGGKYDKSRDIFVFSYFSFTSLQWPFYREIPYKKKVTLAISTFGLETLTFHFLETNKALRYVYF